MAKDNQFLTMNEDISELDTSLPLPEMAQVELEDGSIEFEILNDDQLEEDFDLDLLNSTDHYENLALYLDEEELNRIALEVIEGKNDDEVSRSKHMEDLVHGIENLGLSDEHVETPFDGGCTVFHPLIMENAVKIQAKAEGELLPSSGPVKARLLGSTSIDLEQQAARIETHMNWQLTEQIKEFYNNTQKALLQSALFGDSFKKNYFDWIKGRVCDSLIPIDQFVVNSFTESIEDADRITEIQYIGERELLSRQYSGLYRDDITLGSPYQIDKEEIGEALDELLGFESLGEGYTILEQHVYMDLPGFEHESGVPLPYIITVEEESRQVLAIRKNWEEGAVDSGMFAKREWFTQYGFVPGFGFYNLGYIHLLGNFQDTLTAIMRSLIDAGSFANMQGGFKLKQMRIFDDSALGPGEFRDVEFYGNDISKALYPINFKEPSKTLLDMFAMIDGKGQKYADSTEQVVADATNYGPVGTTMALLDASTKFFSAIYKRFHAAQKNQLRIISRLNFENMPDDPNGITFNIPGQELRITKQDYDDKIDIIPVSDPNISTRSHRLTLASQKLEAALKDPKGLHNLKECYRDYYIALGDNPNEIDRRLPPDKQPQPLEPMQDIMAASKGEPIGTFPDQDHNAHIMVKTAFINDPSVAQNPLYAQVMPILQANIREHQIMLFSQQMEGAQSLGMNQMQAAQQIQEYNAYKAANPLGENDPKQLLAKAEIMKQVNEAKKLDLQEEVKTAEAMIDIAELELELRKQNIDLEQFNLKLASDREIELVRQALEKSKIQADKISPDKKPTE